MAYAALNVLLTLYAFVAYIGVRHSIVDLWIHFKQLLYKPVRPRRRRVFGRKRRTAQPVAPPDWRTVLNLRDDHSPSWPSSLRELLTAAATANVGGIPEPRDFRTVFQPVLNLVGGQLVGYEALTRFRDGSSTEQRLVDAASAGAGMAMEEVLLRGAFQAADAFLPPDRWLAVKASPRLIIGNPSVRLLMKEANRTVVVEINEPSAHDFGRDIHQVRELLPDNCRVALEHARMGHKTLAAIAELKPDFVKLDRSVVSGIATDDARRTDLRNVVKAAADQGTLVIASGIEFSADRLALESTGVLLGQGYLLGRPEEMVDA
jgi:EAL domain-containing protein (putative c-di-GMP-specific phosphodiesterase class I)